MIVARSPGKEDAKSAKGKRTPGRMPIPIAPASKPSSGACACGGSCPRCRDAARVQPKLSVGAPDDAYEREAERIATALVSDGGAAASPSSAGGANAVQRASASPAKLATDGAAEEAARELDEGRPLDAGARGFFEPRLGHDLGGVRVHTGSKAAESANRLGARAYTLGRNVVFGAGEYAPGSASGRHLLAHELVHVVQQGGGAPSAPARGPSMRAGAYSVRLVTEQGERVIGPPELQRGASVVAGSPAGQAPPAAAIGNEAPEEETVPVQRMPKNGSGGAWIQRTATFTKPTPTPQDPLTRLTQGLTPGLTTPKLNGTKISNLGQLTTDLTPASIKQTGKSGANITCAIDSFDIDTTAEQIVSSAAPAGGWKGNVPPDKLDNPPQCAKVAQVPVTMNALPDNANFVKRVQQSEDEHAADLKTLHDRHFAPYDKFINGLTATGADLAACGKNLGSQLNNRHSQAAYAFYYAWEASVQKLDGPGGTHEDTALVKAKADCSSADVTVSQSNPTIAGAAPGNVVTVKPTVTSFNPKTMKVNGNNLEDGKTVVKTFTNAADAKTALALIQHYGMDSRNVIGPMEYFLVGGAAPKGAFKGASELAIDPARYQVTLGLPSAGVWAITDTAGTAKGVSISTLVNFGAKRDEAYSGLAVMTGLGFISQGWVGGTRQKPEMMYFRV